MDGATDNARAILEEAGRSGVTVWLDGEQLRFRARAGSLPPGIFERLREHKPQIIAMLRDGDATKPQTPKFRPRPRPDSLPIIRHHLDRWNDMVAGRSGPRFACGTHFVISVSGVFDVPLFTLSLRMLAARHVILSARVMDDGQGPCFVYDTGHEITPLVVDLSTTADRGSISDHARRLAHDLVWAPFELGKDPWFRAFVISPGSTDHIVGFVIHHFIADKRSIYIAARDLFAISSALAAGQTPALPELRVQYHDYVLAVNEWLASDNVRLMEGFWREHLRGAPTTRIPPDFEVDPDAVGIARMTWFDLPPALTAKLRDRTGCNSLQMHVYLTAALSATLAWFSRSADILTLHRISLRNDAVLSNLVGAFFDAMAVRVPVDLSDSFASCVERTQQVFHRCYEHSAYPFAMVRRVLAEVTETGIAPMMNFIDTYADSEASPGEGATPSGSGLILHRLDVSSLPVETHMARNHPGFYLTVTHQVSGMRARIEYFEQRYTEQTIADFIHALSHVLEAGLTDPAMPLDRLFGADAPRPATAESRYPGPDRSEDPARDSR